MIDKTIIIPDNIATFECSCGHTSGYIISMYQPNSVPTCKDCKIKMVTTTGEKRLKDVRRFMAMMGVHMLKTSIA
jgi:hypothetical protein